MPKGKAQEKYGLLYRAKPHVVRANVTDGWMVRTYEWGKDGLEERVMTTDDFLKRYEPAE